MLKHLFVGAVALSSVALAEPYGNGRQPLPPAPAPLPAVVAPLPPPPPGALVHEARPVMSGARDDRMDVRVAVDLLRDFDRAVAMRDERAMRLADRRLSVFLEQELFEARTEGRFSRRDERTVDELRALQRRFERLTFRGGRFSVVQKRECYADAIELASRDARGPSERDERAHRGHDERGRRG